MSIELSQGSTIAYASAFGASKAMSAVTNAAEGVATLEASHGVVVNDIIVVDTSGWERLKNAVIRAKAVATNDVTLEGFVTSSTSLYPDAPTGGAGTVREVSTFTAITQIKSVQAEAGSVDFVEITNLSNQVRQQIPGLENAPTLTFTVQYDPALSWWTTLLGYSDANTLAPLRITTPAGRKVYANAYWKLSRFPIIQTGQEITHVLTCVVASAIPSSYAS